MDYKLAAQSGDTLPVPQLVIKNLPRADGDAVRVALYLLATGCTDPKAIAHDLALKSVSAADNALLWWAGVGLLEKEAPLSSSPAAPPEQKAAELDLASLDDPYVAVLCEEAQTAFGKALGRHDLQRLVSLYLNDGWKPDVVLLCCAEMARQGRRTVGAVSRELSRWQAAGVETGEDAERYLKREAVRDGWHREAAALFGVSAAELTQWERRAITRWHEEWHYAADMIDEALLHAEGHKTIRYVDGILRSWHAQGKTDVKAVHGRGALAGSNILATGNPAQKPMKDLFHRDWNAVFDDDTEG